MNVNEARACSEECARGKDIAAEIGVSARRQGGVNAVLVDHRRNVDQNERRTTGRDRALANASTHLFRSAILG